MRIERPDYVERLVRKRNNGMIKVITGIRRSGKSYLLFDLFYDYLQKEGVSSDHIIQIALDKIENAKYRNPFALYEYIKSKIYGSERFYVFIDEIQLVRTMPNPDVENDVVSFVDVALSLMEIADVYITGSNSKMLSSDIITEFRGRGDQIRVHPLSFKEFMAAYHGNPRVAMDEYKLYGGLPYVLSLERHQEKNDYLSKLAGEVYLKDILERHQIFNDGTILKELLNMLASCIGSLTNPMRLSNRFLSEEKISVSSVTIARYLEYFEDSFLVSKAIRYNVKGESYIGSPYKYYFADIGLRNAQLAFRQDDESHVMENIIYNDLVRRGYSVDVGTLEVYGKSNGLKTDRKNLEIDFVCNAGSKRIYIQSACKIENDEKRQQEIRGLHQIRDSFKKIIVTQDTYEPWYDEKGILYIGLEDFLLSDDFAI